MAFGSLDNCSICHSPKESVSLDPPAAGSDDAYLILVELLCTLYALFKKKKKSNQTLDPIYFPLGFCLKGLCRVLALENV